MDIGPFRLHQPLALAPMAGVTDRLFRHLCRNLGADYVVSEMMSANPALRDTRKSRLRGAFAGEPEPFAVQIAGSDPQWMADAAIFNVSQGAAIIDINMGCPAKKVCNKLAGSALLSNPEQVRAILCAVVSSVKVPVTLKIRTGPDPDHRNGLLIAQLAEEAGISALAVHGRTRADRFLGQAEYHTIRNIVNAVDMPVFANGDINSPARAVEVLHATGAAGLMIGRAAQGNPWIFREIRHYLDTGTALAPPSPDEVYAVMTRHLRLLHQTYGEQQGVRVARKHISWYLEGRPGASPYRDKLVRCTSPEEQFALLDACFRNADFIHMKPGCGQPAATVSLPSRQAA